MDKNKYNLIKYETENTGALEVIQVKDDVYLTQKQLSQLFNVDRSVITKHIKNIYQCSELDEKSTCAKMEHVGKNGQKYISNYYNLDAIISIGYRVNSKQGVKFRQWATKIIKEQIIKSCKESQMQNYNINVISTLTGLEKRLTDLECKGFKRVECIKKAFYGHNERISFLENKLSKLKTITVLSP